MRIPRALPAVVLAVIFMGLTAPPGRAAPDAPARSAEGSGNLFASLLGKSEADTQGKIEAAWQQLFYGDKGGERVYFPVQGRMAYIADIGHKDVRTEGMSYGMMIAVQLGHHDEFDRLWKWTKTHMYHADGPFAGYFAWECDYAGAQLDPQPAPDGEQWFAMALLFASRRWGDGEGIFNYSGEARTLLRDLRVQRRGVAHPIFDAGSLQVVYDVTGNGGTFTDASYQLPAFYELWALWGPPADREFWTGAARASRQLFRRAANPRTGLIGDCSNFDGTPRPGDLGDFRYDACRTLANVALDWHWHHKDRWAVDQSNRVLRFLAAQGRPCPNQYTLDGRPLSNVESTGLMAMAAVAGLAADREVARPFVRILWETRVPSGQWRYYDGLLYLLALLETGGRFHSDFPVHPA
jgi:oligosaccharide reducing-end xylanase